MNSALWIIVDMIGFAIYLNIGWIFSSYLKKIYFYNNGGFWAIFWCGPDNIFGSQEFENLADDGVPAWVMQFLWPIQILYVSAAWAGYILYIILWFIFAGGIAKALGLT